MRGGADAAGAALGIGKVDAEAPAPVHITIVVRFRIEAEQSQKRFEPAKGRRAAAMDGSLWFRVVAVSCVNASLVAIPRAVARGTQSPGALDRRVAGDLHVSAVLAMPMMRRAQCIAVVVMIAAAA